MKQIKIVSFTIQGAALADKLKQFLAKDIVQIYARSVDSSLQNTALSRLVQQAFYDADAILFIGAAGIAVRSIAPYLRGKTCDPAVVVMDDAGQYAIPILSGHLGGANDLALEIARTMGAEPVITTATDVHGLFAVDEWAKMHGLHIENPHAIRHISGSLLRGEYVGVQSDIPLIGKLPHGLNRNKEASAGILLSYQEQTTSFSNCLNLTPLIIVAGIGCKKGKTKSEIAHALQLALTSVHIRKSALCAIATISHKRHEVGLIALCKELQLPMLVFESDELLAVHGVFTSSDFVEKTVGVDNVCERAAVCGAKGGALVMQKFAHDGITIAFACRHMEVSF